MNESQDGVVVSKDGVAPCHTAGHGNCTKIKDEDSNTIEPDARWNM